MIVSPALDQPHKRYNPLLGEWVLVSPQRMLRPWLGRVESVPPDNSPAFDPHCHLCPGNERAGGMRNPQYRSTYRFANDFPALTPESNGQSRNDGGLIVSLSETGRCEVLCFSPRHDLTVPRMSLEQVHAVIEKWVEIFSELDSNKSYAYVQIFENYGPLIGASNPHPHGQVWANSTLPNIPARESQAFSDYSRLKTSCLLCDYLGLEMERKERLVDENEDFVALVPYWAVWPYEALILSKRHFAAMDDLSPNEMRSLADVQRRLTIRYDNVFQTSCPYSMGFHQRPTDGAIHPDWHFHAHYYPPLLRSAIVQKFMVGYELLGSPQRDLTPEAAAQRLAAATTTHYLDQSK